MTEQPDALSPGEPHADDLPADALIEPHCQATTRDGHPCGNRPIEGRRYCPIHAALDGATSAVPSAAVVLVGSSDDAPIEELPIGAAAAEMIARDDAASVATAPELEVEIRNRDAPAPTRDLAAGALRLLRENVSRLPADAAQRASAMIREHISSDYLDPDFWRGVGMVLRYQVDELAGLAQRRLRGESTTDAYGMDAELVDLVRPLSGFLYRTYWRVDVDGLEHVPAEGRALLVANHGGVLPWDAVMIATAVLEDHASPRVVRMLYPPGVQALPGLEPALAAFGQVRDTAENAARLLADDQLVCVFPEGASGLGKLFWKRYQLQRFRRGGSVAIAIRAGAPIVPVAVVGAEETYPLLANIRPLAEALRLPLFPITPLFPWLGPLGLLPLRSKWSIAFGEPIATAAYGPASADDPALVARLCEDVRQCVQALLDRQLAARPSTFA